MSVIPVALVYLALWLNLIPSLYPTIVAKKISFSPLCYSVVETRIYRKIVSRFNPFSSASSRA